MQTFLLCNSIDVYMLWSHFLALGSNLLAPLLVHPNISRAMEFLTKIVEHLNGVLKFKTLDGILLIRFVECKLLHLNDIWVCSYKT